MIIWIYEGIHPYLYTNPSEFLIIFSGINHDHYFNYIILLKSDRKGTAAKIKYLFEAGRS